MLFSMKKKYGLITALTLTLIPNKITASFLTNMLVFISDLGKSLDEMNKKNRELFIKDFEKKPKKETEEPQSTSEKPLKKRGFATLAGAIPEDVIEIVTYLQESEKLKALGAEMPRGILLVGPPGNGKTAIARAIAEEVGASFHAESAASFMEMYVGVGPKRVREIFAQARESASKSELKKAIIFIDEIDAIGGKRLGSTDHPEQRNTLNELLNQMDGFTQSSEIIVLAATNDAGYLDDALKRPGRFDRIVEIPLPNKESREAIIRLYTEPPRKHCLLDENFATLAQQSAGFSCAELKDLVNEAAIFAVREKASSITYEHCLSSLKKAREKKRLSR
jgi:cell division protease FtsH